MSMKNMAVMFGAMAMMRRIDQEDPLVLWYARAAFVAYVAVISVIFLLIHRSITARRDTSLLRLPVAAKTPSFSEAMAAAQKDAQPPKPASAGAEDGDDNDDDEEKEEAEADKPKDEVVTVMEYDLRKLAAARKSWVTNLCLLAAIHYKMESVSPLVMSVLMGAIRLFTDDPLFSIHLRGAPAVGPLKRPFVAPKNPLTDMLKDMQAKSAQVAEAPQTQGPPGESDLHDDGEAEEDEADGPAPTLADFKDDHIEGDFDEDEHAHEKKDQ